MRKYIHGKIILYKILSFYSFLTMPKVLPRYFYYGKIQSNYEKIFEQKLRFFGGRRCCEF